MKQKRRAAHAYAKKHGLKYDRYYIYAYREHDKWGRGYYNKTITYEKGYYYRDWHCDPRSSHRNSFGMGIWPKGNTPVKVKISDWGVEIPKDCGKARVWGFEVL